MVRIEPACTRPIGCWRASATDAVRAGARNLPLLDGPLRQIGHSRGPCACVTGGDHRKRIRFRDVRRARLKL